MTEIKSAFRALVDDAKDQINEIDFPIVGNKTIDLLIKFIN